MSIIENLHQLMHCRLKFRGGYQGAREYIFFYIIVFLRDSTKLYQYNGNATKYFVMFLEFRNNNFYLYHYCLDSRSDNSIRLKYLYYTSIV